MTGALLAVALAAPAGAASAFVEQLHKAEARDPEDHERVEFATRAIRAWVPADGRPLLGAAHYLRAEGESARWDDAAADEDLAKALETDPRNDRAYLLRARARTSLGRGAEAERDALEYTASRPDDADGWLALGEARLAQGGEKAGAEARSAFAHAASVLGAGDPRPSLGEGRSFLAGRDHRRALAALTAAAGDSKKWRGEVLAERSRAYSALGDWGASRDDLSGAIPELERALERRNRLGAPRAIEKGRRDLGDAYFRRGLAHEALHQKEEALADHKQACGLGYPAGCARVAALEKKEPEAPPAPKPAKPKRRKNPKGDAGDRVYAN